MTQVYLVLTLCCPLYERDSCPRYLSLGTEAFTLHVAGGNYTLKLGFIYLELQIDSNATNLVFWAFDVRAIEALSGRRVLFRSLAK